MCLILLGWYHPSIFGTKTTKDSLCNDDHLKSALVSSCGKWWFVHNEYTYSPPVITCNNFINHGVLGASIFKHTQMFGVPMGSPFRQRHCEGWVKGAWGSRGACYRKLRRWHHFSRMISSNPMKSPIFLGENPHFPCSGKMMGKWWENTTINEIVTNLSHDI